MRTIPTTQISSRDCFCSLQTPAGGGGPGSVSEIRAGLRVHACCLFWPVSCMCARRYHEEFVKNCNRMDEVRGLNPNPYPDPASQSPEPSRQSCGRWSCLVMEGGGAALPVDRLRAPRLRAWWAQVWVPSDFSRDVLIRSGAAGGAAPALHTAPLPPQPFLSPGPLVLSLVGCTVFDT